MSEFEQLLHSKLTKKDRLDFVSDMLSQGEEIISGATGRYEEFERCRKHLGYLWLDRNDYEKQYNETIGWCRDWLNAIRKDAKTIGCSHLVQFPKTPTLKDVYVDPLEKLSDYIDAIKRTVDRLRPMVNELQRQELLPQEKLKPKIVISRPQFKNSYLYVGEYKIKFRKNTISWCMLKAIFNKRTDEDGASPDDIFELADKDLALSSNASKKEIHSYYAVRNKINKRISEKTGIKDDFIEVNNTNFKINKDFGL